MLKLERSVHTINVAALDVAFNWFVVGKLKPCRDIIGTLAFPIMTRFDDPWLELWLNKKAMIYHGTNVLLLNKTK